VTLNNLGKKKDYSYILTSLAWNSTQKVMYLRRRSFTILSISVTGFGSSGAAHKTQKKRL